MNNQKTLELTQEEKRIKIAEALGWHLKIDSSPLMVAGRKSGTLYDGKGVAHGFLWLTEADTLADKAWKLPDYFNDLNATHEAEKALTTSQALSYWSFLEPLACHPGNTPIIFATAAQRAEAFGKTLGLW